MPAPCIRAQEPPASAPPPAETAPSATQPAAPEPVQAPAVPRPALTPAQVEAYRLATEGLQALQRGDFPTATARLHQALESDADNVLANTFLGFLAFRNGDLDKAASHCGKAADGGASPLALLVLGRIAELQRDSHGAEDLYVRAAESGLASPTAQTDGGQAIAAHASYLGSFLDRAQGDHARALENLEQTLRTFPKNVNAWYEKGQVLLELGRPAEAAEAFGHCLADRMAWYAPEAWLYPLRRYLFLQENAAYWRAVALHRAGTPAEAAAILSELTPVVASRFGAETAGSAGGPLRALEGEVDLSYYQSHFELARVYDSMGEKGHAVDTLRGYLRIPGIDPASAARAKELLKTLR